VITHHITARERFFSEYSKFAVKTAQSTVEMCRVVYEAKKSLQKSEYDSFLLDIGRKTEDSTIRKYLAVGERYDDLIAYTNLLPASWTSIYEITQLPAESFMAMVTLGESMANLTGAQLKRLTLSPAAAVKAGWAINQDGRVRSAWEYLAYKDITLHHLRQVWPELVAIEDEIGAQIEIEALYAAYLDRQSEDVAALRRDESLTLPGDLDYDAIGGLSNEVRSKLKTVRPLTLGQAARIEGITPGALTALLGYVKRVRRTG
jgi:hypothetical protein